jgi:Flp pilus assembly protein TadD
MNKLLIGATAIAVVLAPTAASASDVSAGSDLLGTPSLSDLTTEVTGQLPWLQKTYCSYSAPKPKSLSLKTALADATSYLRKHSSAGARHEFASTSAAKTERGSLTAAAEATAASSTLAALDAVLRAHQLDPRDPLPLIDAGPILTDLKLPNEALAALAAAGRLKAPEHEPWGISAKALLANNKGYALLALKKWSAAESALADATQASPDLSEAEINLALADVCQGKAKPAAHMMFFGVRRSPQVVGDLVEGGTGYPTPTQAGITA